MKIRAAHRVFFLAFIFVASTTAIAMGNSDEIDAELQSNPKGARAALCFSFAEILSKETAYDDNKEIHPALASVIERSSAQGKRFYSDSTVFQTKAVQATRYFSGMLQTPDKTARANMVANMRSQISNCLNILDKGSLAAGGRASGEALANVDLYSLAKAKNCMVCHTFSSKMVGPAYKDIGAKYAGQKDAEDKLTHKVLKGGSGVWGTIAMPANSQVTEAEARILVKWILRTK